MANASTPQNVFYYAVEDASMDDADVKDAFEDYFINTWADEWENVANTQCVLDYASLDVINPDGTIARTLGTFTIDVNGVGIGQVMPAAVSAFISANTAVPKIRGRKYLPGMDEGNVDAGKLNTGALTSLALLLIYYMATFDTGTATHFVPGVLSRSLQYFVAFDASGLVNDIPAYQRRRKPGVGS